MILLSVNAGLRAKEIATLTWSNGDRRAGRTRRRHPPSQFGFEGKERRTDRSAQSRSPPRARGSTSKARRRCRATRADHPQQAWRRLLVCCRRGLVCAPIYMVRWASMAPHPTAGAGRSLPRLPRGSSRPAVGCGIFRSSPATVALSRRSDISKATAGPIRNW
jgi:hypothetical protein